MHAWTSCSLSPSASPEILFHAYTFLRTEHTIWTLQMVSYWKLACVDTSSRLERDEPWRSCDGLPITKGSSETRSSPGSISSRCIDATPTSSGGQPLTQRRPVGRPSARFQPITWHLKARDQRSQHCSGVCWWRR
jgi:hypothetical protein